MTWEPGMDRIWPASEFESGDPCNGQRTLPSGEEPAWLGLRLPWPGLSFLVALSKATMPCPLWTAAWASLQSNPLTWSFWAATGESGEELAPGWAAGKFQCS